MESELQRLRKKVENYPSPSSYTRLAELLRLSGDLDGAAQVCSRCIKEFPRNGQAHVILATVQLTLNQADKALATLNEGVKADARSYSGHRMLADIYIQRGELDRAMRHLKQVLAFKPDDQVVKGLLADLEKDSRQPRNHETGQEAAPRNDARTVTVDLDTVDLTNSATLSTIMRTIPGAAPPSPQAVLDRLAGLKEVKGAVVFDQQGRLLVSRGLSGGRDELLAALANEVQQGARDTLGAASAGALRSWSIAAERGQVVAFTRPGAPTLAALAEPGIKTALLEMHAQQALLDLGAR